MKTDSFLDKMGSQEIIQTHVLKMMLGEKKHMKFGIYAQLQNPRQFKKTHEQMYREILEQIEHADKRGYHTFNTLEHHWFEDFSISANPMALFAAAAQRTKQIHFRTCAHILPLHNPIVFAGQVATTAILTDGRFEFAVARGHAWTYSNALVPLEESRGRLLESIEILEKAMTEDTFSYHGKYYSIENVRVIPKPQRKPRIRIAGVSKFTFELAGEKGWGVVVSPIIPLEKIQGQLDAYRKSCKKHGHEPDIVYVQALYLDENGEKARVEAKNYVKQFMESSISPITVSPPKNELLTQDFSFYASGLLEYLIHLPYDTLIEEEYAWVGSPTEIKEKIDQLIEKNPDITEIALICSFAGLEHWKTIRTQDLFSKQVMPYFVK